MLRTVGLKGPPPPLIVILAEAIGLHPGWGLGEALALGDGVAVGVGLGVTPSTACLAAGVRLALSDELLWARAGDATKPKAASAPRKETTGEVF